MGCQTLHASISDENCIYDEWILGFVEFFSINTGKVFFIIDGRRASLREEEVSVRKKNIEQASFSQAVASFFFFSKSSAKNTHISAIIL